jgi:hypothetical protein
MGGAPCLSIIHQVLKEFNGLRLIPQRLSAVHRPAQRSGIELLVGIEDEGAAGRRVDDMEMAGLLEVAHHRRPVEGT